MAYGSIFPAGYQPMFYQPQPQQLPPTQMSVATQNNNNNGITWVQGEAGAKSYLVAPNTTVQLWDSEAQTIYLKSADASGMPSMKVLDYTIRNASVTSQEPHTATKDDEGYIYATKQDLESVLEEIAGMKRRINDLAKPKPRSTKEAAKDE